MVGDHMVGGQRSGMGPGVSSSPFGRVCSDQRCGRQNPGAEAGEGEALLLGPQKRAAGGGGQVPPAFHALRPARARQKDQAEGAAALSRRAASAPVSAARCRRRVG